MPFIEVIAPEGCVTDKRTAAQQLTQALCDTYVIDANIVTIYFVDVLPSHYWHSGASAVSGPNSVFVKVHALRRDRDKRRDAAVSLTRALTKAISVASADIAIYFLEREEDECAHGGQLTSDRRTS